MPLPRPAASRPRRRDRRAAARADGARRGARGSTAASAASDARAPLLDRPMRLVASSWEVVASLLAANGGLATADGSLVRAEGLDLRVRVAGAPRDVEGALARGGADDAGADVAVVPLPWLVTSFERVRALEPRVVHVPAWSHGREVLLGTTSVLLARPGPIAADVPVASSDPSATALALFALDVSGTPPSHLHVVSDRKGATIAALARPLASEAPADEPSRLLLSTAEASRLLPYVAVAARGFAKDDAIAIAGLLRAWDKGAAKLRADVPGAARAIATEKNAPEPSVLLERLGWLAEATPSDAAEALGLAGNDATLTVGLLFTRAWELLRATGALTLPAPDAPPIDTTAFALAFPGVAARPAVAAPPAPEGARVLLAARAPAGDAAAVAQRVALLQAVFERSVIRVAAKPASLARDAADEATGRLHVPAERIVVAPKALGESGALVEVLAPP